jgi:signal peptidase II
MMRFNKNSVALVYAFSIVAIDQITKFLVRHFMSIDEIVPLLGKYLRLRFILNPGMAFGFQIGGRMFFIFFSSLACLIILIFLFRMKGEHIWGRFALASILGGAVGNLIDRIFVGEVVDFVEVGPWPIFNVADVAVTCGMIILIITMLLDKEEESEPDH